LINRDELTITNKVALLAMDGFEDAQLIHPKIRFKEEGFQTESLIFYGREIIRKHGFSLKPDKLFREVNLKDYIGVFVPEEPRIPII
jgi:putative intracellular protease/amidase